MDSPAADWSVGQYLDWWLTNIVPRHRESTIRSYSQAVERFRRRLDADAPLAQLSRSQLQAAVDAELADGHYSVATVRVWYGAIACALKMAFDDRLIDRNPTNGVRLPHVEVGTTPAPTDEELLAFLRACLAPGGLGGQHWYGAVIAAGAMTGLRTGELRGLMWEYVHMGAQPTAEAKTEPGPGTDMYELLTEEAVGHLYVAGQAEPNCTRPGLVKPKSYAAFRSVPISTTLAAVLEAQRERTQRHARRRGSRSWVECGLVFPSTSGRPAATAAISHARRKIALEAGISTVPTIRALRHAWISFLVDAGVPLSAVAKMAGHQSSAFTERIYYNTTRRSLNQAAAAVTARTLLTPARDGSRIAAS